MFFSQAIFNYEPRYIMKPIYYDMKRILFLLAVFTVLAVACKKTPRTTVTVVRDCTGTYLRMDGKDYLVCNLEQVERFADGAVVKASFKRLKECNGSAKDRIVCMMVHEHEGWIEVLSIE